MFGCSMRVVPHQLRCRHMQERAYATATGAAARQTHAASSCEGSPQRRTAMESAARSILRRPAMRPPLMRGALQHLLLRLLSPPRRPRRPQCRSRHASDAPSPIQVSSPHAHIQCTSPTLRRRIREPIDPSSLPHMSGPVAHAAASASAHLPSGHAAVDSPSGELRMRAGRWR